MGAMASQITSLPIVYSTVYSSTVQRKHQSSASLAFVWGIHRWPVNSPHKKTSNAENVSIWRRHPELRKYNSSHLWQKFVWTWNNVIMRCIWIKSIQRALGLYDLHCSTYIWHFTSIYMVYVHMHSLTPNIHYWILTHFHLTGNIPNLDRSTTNTSHIRRSPLAPYQYNRKTQLNLHNHRFPRSHYSALCS